MKLKKEIFLKQPNNEMLLEKKKEKKLETYLQVLTLYYLIFKKLPG